MQCIRSILSQKRLAGGALVLAVTQFAASFMGFVRDQAFSLTFPLGADPLGVASIYISSFRVSDLLFQMFVMSSLSVVLVPFLAAHLAHQRTDEMNRIATSVMTMFGIVFGVIALVLALIFPWIAPYMVQFDGEALQLYIQFGRLALLTNFLFVFGNTLGQYLIAIQRYWIYGLTPVLWALGTVFGVYVLTPIVGLMGPMYGTVIGSLIYVLLRLFGAMWSGFRFRLPDSSWLHPELKEMGWLILPRMAALGALQFQLLIFDTIGSGMESDAIAVNAFARNFQSVIIGVAGIALAQSAFSLLSQAAAHKDYDRFSMYLRKGIGLNLLLTLPAAIGLAVLAFIPAWLLHLIGDTRTLFISMLMVYCVSIPFESMNHLLLRAYYALKNTMFPAVSTVCAMAAGITAAYFTTSLIGLFALPLGFTVGQIVQLVTLSTALPGYIAYEKNAHPSRRAFFSMIRILKKK